MSYDYDLYLKEHIGAVTKGLIWMMDHQVISGPKASLALENAGKHDESKYTQEEYKAYDDYFYGGNRSFDVKRAFDYAWLHHQHHNPHHWQYWVLTNDDEKDGTVALEMPEEYVYEMIADWWTFSWRNDSLLEIFDWYEEHRNRMILHKKTRKLVEDILLGKMRPILTSVEDAKEEVIQHSDTEEDDDKKYGVPELKKFPMPDADHVKSAIRFFNYVDPKYEKELAEAILERMKEYGMSFEDFGVGDENRFKNYIPKENDKNEKE